MLGLGKYDKQATQVRESTQAEGVLVLVFNGLLGTGFSAQISNLDLLANLPTILRSVATDIEESGGVA